MRYLIAAALAGALVVTGCTTGQELVIETESVPAASSPDEKQTILLEMVCPEAKVVTGGGYQLGNANLDEAGEIIVDQNWPDVTEFSQEWVVRAHGLGRVDAGWGLTGFAVCVDGPAT